MEIAYQKNGVFKLSNKQVTLYFVSTLAHKPALTAKDLLVSTEWTYPEPECINEEGQQRKIFGVPGDFEVGGTTLVGIQVERIEEEKQVLLHSVFSVRIEDILFTYIGNGVEKLSTSQLEHLSDTDILFFPVSKDSIEQSSTILKNLEPSIGIPYSLTDNAEDIAAFCKNRGIDVVPATPTLTLKKSEIVPEEERIVLLG
ncbi:MAG: MBL fold metallo-hydrolase [bacterium]